MIQLRFTSVALAAPEGDGAGASSGSRCSPLRREEPEPKPVKSPSLMRRR